MLFYTLLLCCNGYNTAKVVLRIQKLASWEKLKWNKYSTYSSIVATLTAVQPHPDYVAVSQLSNHKTNAARHSSMQAILTARDSFTW